ncbi:hypothetical protein N0V90_011415 [Kalmusia sp. IMI 367209]|nr:hypothetical protein N0V90_011415 [Kalmusia sp. IMI 367209]
MSTVVAVAGGSNGLGRAIVDALKETGRYEVLIFSRKVCICLSSKSYALFNCGNINRASVQENPELEKVSGVRVLAADYASVDALHTLLESNKVSVLISTANTLVDATPEFNLIKAAAKSSVTKRIIPNTWSALEFKDEFTNFPIAKSRLQALEELKKTDLEWTAIYPGLFMEVTVEGLPSYLAITPLMFDVKNNAASLPNKGEAPITLTYSHDIAKYVARLLNLQKWESAYYIAGDVKTWNEILAAAEASKGVKFNVSYDSIEKLQKGQVTELPGHAGVYELFGGRDNALPIVQGLFAQYGLWMEEGIFTYKSGKLLNDLFPDIKPLKLEDAWKKASGKA